MAFELKAIRDALADNLGAIPKLRVYDTAPDSPEVPAAVILTGDDPFIDYLGAMAKGQVDLNLRIQLLVQRSSASSAQDALDELLSAGTGQRRSVIDALEADRTLGGTVSDCALRTATGYGSVDVGGTTYGTATLHLLVLVPRK